MADVKIIDIGGEQWDIKDQVARQTLTEQEVKINNLQENLSTTNNKIYLDKSKNIDSTGTVSKWIKMGGLYPANIFSPNVYLIGVKRGGIYLLSCSKESATDYWTPVLIRLYDPLIKITSMKMKGKFVYIESGGWNTISIQQLNDIPKQFTVIEEDPPEDAIDIPIIEK